MYVHDFEQPNCGSLYSGGGFLFAQGFLVPAGDAAALAVKSAVSRLSRGPCVQQHGIFCRLNGPRPSTRSWECSPQEGLALQGSCSERVLDALVRAEESAAGKSVQICWWRRRESTLAGRSKCTVLMPQACRELLAPMTCSVQYLPVLQ